MEVEENKESDPANACNDDDILDSIWIRCAACGIELHAIRRRFTAGQTVEVKVTLVIVGRAKEFAFLQRLIERQRERVISCQSLQ